MIVSSNVIEMSSSLTTKFSDCGLHVYFIRVWARNPWQDIHGPNSGFDCSFFIFLLMFLCLQNHHPNSRKAIIFGNGLPCMEVRSYLVSNCPLQDRCFLHKHPKWVCLTVLYNCSWNWNSKINFTWEVFSPNTEARADILVVCEGKRPRGITRPISMHRKPIEWFLPGHY